MVNSIQLTWISPFSCLSHLTTHCEYKLQHCEYWVYPVVLPSASWQPNSYKTLPYLQLPTPAAKHWTSILQHENLFAGHTRLSQATNFAMASITPSCMNSCGAVCYLSIPSSFTCFFSFDFPAFICCQISQGIAWWFSGIFSSLQHCWYKE